MKKWQGRRREALPAVPKAVNERTIMLGRLAVLVTIVAWLAFGTLTVAKYLISQPQARTYGVWEAALYLVVLTLLTLSALAYLTTRLGCFYRSRSHARVPRAALDEFFAESSPTLTVLVPSYREQAAVVRKTLLSAALQEHPNMRVVLLIDDPPEPTYAYQAELLEQARRLPREVEALLALPKARVEAAFASFEMRLAAADDLSERERAIAQVGPSEIRLLAENYEHAVRWLKDLAASQEALDNSDRFFSEHVLGGLARDLERTGEALRSAVGAGAGLSAARVQELYRRLVNTFSAQLSSFERKRYCSLSPEPNKAMNLNSYIGLMGGSYREAQTSAGIALVASPDGKLQIPDCDYVLTLDADSVLLPEYCTRLVYLLERREHGRVAVAQTPYSAYPLAETSIERIAGATTDVQHIIHQGMTHYDATFWVGANAVLRKTALDEVCETEYVSDWPIKRYIQDRTVIEDTESSVDLRVHGWSLLNYPERLSYSSTPVDFGSLCIQRRRWANGGLLILGKVFAEVRARRARGERTRIGELLLRFNYMASTAWCSVCLLVLLAFQFSNRLLSPLVFLIAVPYFLAMAEDLRRCGYRRIDVLRVYGFNLLLLPVNLAGAGSSIMQGLTGAKGEFKRTPKVRQRTLPSLSFVLVPYALVGFSAFTIVEDLHRQHWANLVFAAINAVLGAYAILAFVGLRNSIVDTWSNIASWLYKPASAGRPVHRHSSTALPTSPHAPVPDWALVLHFGEAEHRHSAAIQSAVRPQLPPPESTLIEGTPGQPMLPAGRWRITDAPQASDAAEGASSSVATQSPDGEPQGDRRAQGERRCSSQGILTLEDERRSPGDRRAPENALS